MKIKIGAIIQARQNSSRFPDKVIANLNGKPLILRLIEQVSYSEFLDKIIVATSEEQSDDGLSELCRINDVSCFRGSLNNVLGRFIDAANHYDIDVVIRITGDNPLTDPWLLDQVIRMYKSDNTLDYINNVHVAGSVHGSGCELVTRASLIKSQNMVENLPDRKEFAEHVTLYIRKNTDIFNTAKFYPDSDLCRNNISYSVDYPEDLLLVEKIHKGLYSKNIPIKTENILRFLDMNPNLLTLNRSLHDNLPDY